jgi:hypothetical protein
MRLGRSPGGRDILCAAVHHPQIQFGQGKRLFIIARQHGNEVSGTEAALAILQHFATSQGALECDTLRYLTIIVVPMANPDGAAAGRRRNSNGVDLNRDWSGRTQAETQAIERGVRAWKPHAVLDLHELPASSGKPEYAESFVETIGGGGGIPSYVSGHTLPAASDLSAWMGRYRQRGTIYYDHAGQDRRLCHRHFGLDLGIPSFLVEAKTGAGRSLQWRVALHALSALVVANYLIHNGTPQGVELAQEIGATEGEPEQEEGPAADLETAPGVRLLFIRAQEGGPDGAQVEAAVQGCRDVRCVRFYIDGMLRALSNCDPYRCSIPATGLAEGEHDIRAEAVGPGGRVLAQAEATFSVETVGVAGE